MSIYCVVAQPYALEQVVLHTGSRDGSRAPLVTLGEAVTPPTTNGGQIGVRESYEVGVGVLRKRRMLALQLLIEQFSDVLPALGVPCRPVQCHRGQKLNIEGILRAQPQSEVIDRI